MPYFGSDPKKQEMEEYHIAKGYLYTTAMNECIHNHPEKNSRGILSWRRTELDFSLEQFWFCLTGLKKQIYYGVYGWDAGDYLEIYDRIRMMAEAELERRGYRGNVFMVMAEDIKQVAVVFGRRETGEPTCTPEELARGLGDLAEQIYQQTIFRGDTRYCNTTALSDALSGFEGIRGGYLQARALNDLSFFRMSGDVLTGESIAELRNSADYEIVTSQCHRLANAAGQGDFQACKDCLEQLFLHSLKRSFDFGLVADSLSYIKNFLHIRYTVYNIPGRGELADVCEGRNYITIEECFHALLPVFERLCRAVAAARPCSSSVIRAAYYIHVHIMEDISLSDMAEYANTAPTHLSKIFHQQTGQTVKQYQTWTRICRAKELLKDSEMAVGEVARLCGFGGRRYFSDTFKKHTGKTPQQYREERE